MISKKINKFIQIAIENSNLEKKEFSQLNDKNIFINLQNTQTILYIKVLFYSKRKINNTRTS